MRRVAGVAAILAAPCAHAHGFGQRYDLPLPLELYLCGAALTVVLSCVMLAFFLRRAPGAAVLRGADLLSWRAGRALVSDGALAVLRAAALAAFALVIFAGLFGNQNPFRNLAPLTVWALWWVGLAYFSAFVGDLWKLANPLDTLFAPFERFSLRRPLPPWVRAWPAVALYLLFLWMEIAWDGSDSPRAIALAALAYAALTWTAMAIFGPAAWLEHGDVFARVFSTLARFAPLHVEMSGRRITSWRLRPYAVGLLQREPLDASLVAFVILLLAGVSFDGFLETPAWEALEWPRAAGLVAAPALFAGVYLAFCRLIAACGGMAADRARRIAGLFVLTLVPIAIGYLVAHYLSFLVQAWQYLLALASDPFGWGWNLFGTAQRFVRIGIVDAKAVWIVSMAAIVAGHVAALYLGHVLSLREFPDRRAAARSQGPMLVLMVGYTMLSLWIIAQPIVGTR